MKLFLKGIIIGLAKVIPGVSGSVVAISLGEYDNLIKSISNINKNNIIYLLKISLGILLSIILGSKLLLFLINKYQLYILIIFAILIMLTIPKIIKEVDNFYYTIITIIFILFLYQINDINITPNYLLLGIIESISMIVPGLSGTAIYNSLGLYDEMLYFTSTLYLLDFNKILPFSIGLIIGTLSTIKLINYCLNNHKSKMYSIILGLLISTLFLMLIKR